MSNQGVMGALQAFEPQVESSRKMARAYPRFISRGLALFLVLIMPAGLYGQEQGSPPRTEEVSDVVRGMLTYSPEGRVEEYISRAVDAHDRLGDLDGARDWLERALELDPHNEVARAMLKQVKEEQQQAGLGRMSAALGTLQQMMERAAQRKEEQQAEEPQEVEQQPASEPSTSQEPTRVEEGSSEGTHRFGKPWQEVQTIKEAPAPSAPPPAPSAPPRREAAPLASSPKGPSYEGLARALELALPRQPIQQPGSSPAEMWGSGSPGEGKEQYALPPTSSSPGQTIDASRLSYTRCSPEELEELVGMLNETGRMLIWLMANQEGGTGQQSGRASSDRGGEASPPSPFPSQGQALMAVLGNLCEKLKSIKPKGLKGMLPRGGKGPGGCAWALFMEGLGGPGGGMGQRALECIEKHSQQGPPPMEPTQVRFPQKDCARGRPGGGRERDYDKYLRAVRELTPSSDYRVRPWLGGIRIVVFETDAKGNRLGAESHFFDRSGNWVRSSGYTNYADGTRVETGSWQEGDVSKLTVKVYDKDGNLVHQTTDTYKNGKLVDHKETVKLKTKETGGGGGDEGRPTEPGEGDCDESEAMKRARAIFECIFGEPDAVAPGGTPEPVTYPAGPSGPPAPKDCNEVSMAAIWGSSTAAGGGATDPEGPEDFMVGGPTTKGFIPKLEGAIDPPKEAVSIPGGGKGKGGKGLPGDEDVPPCGGKCY